MFLSAKAVQSPSRPSCPIKVIVCAAAEPSSCRPHAPPDSPRDILQVTSSTSRRGQSSPGELLTTCPCSWLSTLSTQDPAECTRVCCHKFACLKEWHESCLYLSLCGCVRHTGKMGGSPGSSPVAEGSRLHRCAGACGGMFRVCIMFPLADLLGTESHKAGNV